MEKPLHLPEKSDPKPLARDFEFRLEDPVTMLQYGPLLVFAEGSEVFELLECGKIADLTTLGFVGLWVESCLKERRKMERGEREEKEEGEREGQIGNCALTNNYTEVPWDFRVIS